MEARDEVMAFFRRDDEEGEKTKPAVPPSFPFYGHTGDQSRLKREEYYNLFDKRDSMPVTSPICGDLEKVFRPPLYDEYGDRFSEDEGPKWDISSCSSSSEYPGQGERNWQGFIENIPYETHKEEHGEVSGIWDEVAEVSVTDGHGLPLRKYFKE